MAKREEPEEEGSGYSWMDTYGDMVTLLLCFFVLLYSFSSLDAGKQQQLVNAFSGTAGDFEVVAFNAATIRENPITDIDSMVNIESRGQKTPSLNAQQVEINDTFDQLYMKIKTYIQDNSLEGSLGVSRNSESIFLRFNEMALFDSASADIRPESIPILEHIMQIIKLNIVSISSVQIEGHTDNVPISNVKFEDNWDLSVKRATNTLRLVLSTGLLDEKMLSAVGYGEYHPIATNDTAEGRAQNRRVDFVLMKADAEDASDASNKD